MINQERMAVAERDNNTLGINIIADPFSFSSLSTLKKQADSQ
jgi:hypothetical protein